MEIPLSTEQWEWGEKNKQGEKFQGNRGKTRTKEGGEKGSLWAKGKQMEEALELRGPIPVVRSRTEGCPARSDSV